MDQILIKLLEQTPVIIVLGLGVYVLYKDKKELTKQATAERKAHAKQIKEQTEGHAAELKELNEYIRGRDLETLEAVETVADVVKAIQTQLNKKK
tara:strand:+ start:942 stop:1226 length:285 start_codon:yes stop_codon:yes gene_type:complete